MKSNIVICAYPREGKSALILRILNGHKGPTEGLVTKDIIERSKKMGLQMGPLKKGGEIIPTTVAHVNFKTGLQVAGFGVDLDALNQVCFPEWKEEIGPQDLLYIDEIGEVPLAFEGFQALVTDYFNRPNTCVATITESCHIPFVDELRKREDVILVYLTSSTKGYIQSFVVGLIQKIAKAKQYALRPEIFFREGDMVECRTGGDEKKIINLKGKTCTCGFYDTFKEFHVCAHILAAEELFKV